MAKQSQSTSAKKPAAKAPAKKLTEAQRKEVKEKQKAEVEKAKETAEVEQAESLLVTVEDINKLLKAGMWRQAENLLPHLPDGAQKNQYTMTIAEMKAKSKKAEADSDQAKNKARLAAEVAEPVEKLPGVKSMLESKINPRNGDPSQILATYNKLIEQLMDMEVQQKKAGKAWRIYFIHRNRLIVMRLNLIKSMR